MDKVWPSPDGHGRLLNMGKAKSKRRSPRKGEGKPTICKRQKRGREGGREGFTYLQKRVKEKSRFVCMPYKVYQGMTSRMAGMPQPEAGKLLKTSQST